jgi:thiol-disulfide isomerase/thioredoxin
MGLAALTFTASAATLGPGDVAPPLPVYKWAKGTPIKHFEAGKVYVVEFWATWCVPCKVSFPHLTELAKKYSGRVTFAGVSISESATQQPGGTDISYIPKVEQFVKTEGAQMAYNVGIDGPTGSADRNWMAAAGQDGIPTAFIVGKTGKIMWIGHPMVGLDEALSKVLNGTLDIAAERAKESKQLSADNAKESVLQPWSDAMEASDWARAVVAADQALAAHPEMSDDLIPAKFEALARKDPAEANSFAASLEHGSMSTHGELLNQIAWTMVDDSDPLKGMDYGVAQALAAQALKQCKPGSSELAETTDTLALAEYKGGSVARAIDDETKAIALYQKVRPEDQDTLKEMKGRLASFRAKKV